MALLLESSKEYFKTLVDEGLSQQGVSTYPQVSSYIVSLLVFFVDSRNLFESEFTEVGEKKPQTLAEMFLLANSSEHSVRTELLKKLGDRSLYISGFFGDSLSRKLVDLDYYRDMGVTAYASLASTVKEDGLAKVYTEMATKFVPLTDTLTFISQKSFITSDSSILRLYERYLRTGSELAKSRLMELGVLSVNDDKKMLKQS